MLNFEIRLLDIQDKKWEWLFRNPHFQSRGVLYLLKGGYMDARDYFREEGRQEGWQKGRQERDKELVLNLLKKKQDISFISEVTGLSEKTIRKLKNSK